MNFYGSNEFSLDEIYVLCIKFMKEKEGKAFLLSYRDRLQLAALSKQVAHGPYQPAASPEVGFLDVVGSDRKASWRALGDLSRDRAQERFVELLDRACPLLQPFLEAHLKEKKEQERQQRELEERRLAEEQRRMEEQRKLAEEQRRLEEEQQKQRAEEQQKQRAEEQQKQHAEEQKQRAEEQKQRAEEQKQRAQAAAAVAALQESHGTTDSPGARDRRLQQESQIRAALNEQTAAQFRLYAGEQHPDDPRKQEELIRQLQEQHFQQYMAQVYQQQMQHQQPLQQQQQQQQENGDAVDKTIHPAAAASDQEAGPQPVANGNGTSANMWTHPHVTVEQFKVNLSADPDAKLKIGAGEVVTVRVPTHEEGNCIVWEFATDHYDIGFGLYFEWTEAASDKVTVHISESSDEEEEEEEDAGKGGEIGADSPDASAAGSQKAKDEAKDCVDEIIPVYRRDCQQEVYCGSHQYPGRGVYLLKFDNSYSLWRSKWLYYRVYYTK